MIDQIRRMLHPLQVRIANTIARGVVKLVNDDTMLQSLQVKALAGEVLEDVERFQEYGFTSIPPIGAEVEVTLVFPGGNRDHAIAVALEHRPARPKSSPPGTTTLYNSTASRISIEPDGTVRITTSQGVVIESGDVTISGDVTSGGISFADLVAAYNIHTHTDPQGGSTGPPIPTV